MDLSHLSLKVSVAAAAILAAASGASASIIATFVSVSPGQGVEFTINSGANWQGTTAGQFNWVGDASNGLGLDGNFTAFCLDLTQFISGGQVVTFEPLPGVAGGSLPGNPALGTPIDAPREALISELWGRNYAGLSSAQDFAAFQIAVWEIIYDDGLDTATGFAQFRNNAPAIAQADGFLAALDGTGPQAPLFALTTETAQDMLVPTPGAMGLMGLGLAACARRRRA
ncbi:hypothetical protein BH11PLA1_BH11PLA1_24330 [soil metagenome]